MYVTEQIPLFSKFMCIKSGTDPVPYHCFCDGTNVCTLKKVSLTVLSVAMRG